MSRERLMYRARKAGLHQSGVEGHAGAQLYCPVRPELPSAARTGPLTRFASSLLSGSSTAFFCFTLVSSFFTPLRVDLGWMGRRSSDRTSFSPAPTRGPACQHRRGIAKPRGCSGTQPKGLGADTANPKLLAVGGQRCLSRAAGALPSLPATSPLQLTLNSDTCTLASVRSASFRL